jgi:trehalose utilization protein
MFYPFCQEGEYAMAINLVVWNEFRHEKAHEEVRKVYPDGIHTLLATTLGQKEDIVASTATLDEPEHGLTDAVLANTDVLIWWGHMAHHDVSDAVVARVQQRILEGMGLIVLHSGHFSKIFRAMLGTPCALKWREIGEKERLWNIDPAHPITQGIGAYIELPNTEMYGEPFTVPEPDKVVFISWFEGGEVFRSGCTWQRGYGKIFYFRPGHETFPIFYNPQIIQVLENAVRWAYSPYKSAAIAACPNVKEPLEHVTIRPVDLSVTNQ